MRFVGAVVCALLLEALVALPAAGADGFSELRVVGAGPVAQPVAALDGRGDGALAWVDGTRAHVARRVVGGAWRPQVFSRRGRVRDVDLVITRGGETIVAWAAGRVPGRSSTQVLAAVAPRGRPFERPQVIAAGDMALNAVPRIAELADGRLVLVWRATRRGRFLPLPGELRVAVRDRGRRFGRSRGLGRDGSSPTIVATPDGGAIVAWSVPTRGGPPRVLRAARLSPRGLRLGRSFQFAAAASAGARLAAGPGNVVIASWQSRRRPAGVLVARLLPTRGPARVLTVRGQEAATIAFAPDGSALATFPDSYPEPGEPGGSGPEGRGPWVASGAPAGEFAAPVRVAPTGAPEVTTPYPAILPTGETFVVWSQTPAAPGPVKWDVIVARRPAGSSTFAGVETLGPGTGLTLAHAGNRVLVAWPAERSGGGLAVTEHS